MSGHVAGTGEGPKQDKRVPAYKKPAVYWREFGKATAPADKNGKGKGRDQQLIRPPPAAARGCEPNRLFTGEENVSEVLVKVQDEL